MKKMTSNNAFLVGALWLVVALAFYLDKVQMWWVWAAVGVMELFYGLVLKKNGR